MKIRTLKEKELKLFFKYANLEGWDMEEIHTLSLFQTHPDDFFIALEGEEVIGFIEAIKYSREFGFISSFLVLKEFRSLGYGKKIFEFALKHLQGCQVALNAIVGKEEIYKAAGFQSYFELYTYKYTIDKLSPSSNLHTIVIDENTPFITDDIYLKSMLSKPEITSIGLKNEGRVSEYALMFVYKDGYKVLIYSQDLDSVKALFFSLTNRLKEGSTVYIQASKLTPVLLQFVKTLQMDETSKFIRMYNKIID